VDKNTLRGTRKFQTTKVVLERVPSKRKLLVHLSCMDASVIKKRYIIFDIENVTPKKNLTVDSGY